VVHAIWTKSGFGLGGKTTTFQEAVAATSQAAGQAWKYVTAAPAADWFQPSFTDGSWTSAQAPFADANGRTPWKTPEIWIRRTVTPAGLTADEIRTLTLRMWHDEDVEVYINGVQAVARTGYITAYQDLAISQEARAAIKPGQPITLAAHCKQTVGGQFLDLGLYKTVTRESVPPDAAFLAQLKALLLHPSAAVRRAALGALPPTAAAAASVRDQKRLCDPDAHVRIKALDVLRAMPATTGLTMRTADAALDKHVIALLAAVPSPIQQVADCAEPALDPVSGISRQPVRAAAPRMALVLGAAGTLRLLWSLDARPGTLRITGPDGRTAATLGFDGRALRGGPVRLPAGLWLFDLTDEAGSLQLRGKVAQAF
jgi:hypothetical protein